MTLEKLFSVNNKIIQLLGRTINIRESAAKSFRKRIGGVCGQPQQEGRNPGLASGQGLQAAA